MKQAWASSKPTDGQLVAKLWTPQQDVFEPDQSLVFVASGNTALTRRLKPLAQYEIMMKDGIYSRRVGLLVHPSDLTAARQYLESTQQQRAKARLQSQKRRNLEEAKYRRAFADEVKQQFPVIPYKDLQAIVARATEKGSGRVGRDWQMELSEKAKLATIAHVRHNHTDYDLWLQSGFNSDEAREKVYNQIERKLAQWATKSSEEAKR